MLCCLEVGRQFFLFVHVNLLFELLFTSALFLPFGLEGDHLLVGLLQLQCLLLLSFLFGVVKSLLELFLTSLLRFDSLVQVANLTLFYRLQSHRIIARLLNLLHKLILLLGQVIDSGEHLFLVLFRLIKLDAGDALRAYRPFGIIALLL